MVFLKEGLAWNEFERFVVFKYYLHLVLFWLKGEENFF